VADPIEQFRAAMDAAGLTCDGEIIADGKLHRYRGPGDDPGEKTGFYVLHTDGVAAGSFGHWRDHPEPIKWKAGDREITPQVRAAITKQISAAKVEREEEHTQAAERSRQVWAEAKNADPDHPYLVAKSVRAHGIKEDSKGRLLVPVYVDGVIMSLQSIDEKGEKKFARGGKVAGGSYRLGGKPGHLVYVAEGYATAASIYEVTGCVAPVEIAFSAGNLLPVAQSLRKKYPKAQIVIAADNDSETDGNPGITHARDAAKTVHGRIAIPTLKGSPAAKCDFNDVAKIDGADAVRAVLEQAAGLLGVSAASITVTPTEWEWRNRFPRGEVVMLDADPGIGKTTVALDLAARVSKGNPWPDGAPCETGNVIVVSAEDSPNTLAARLKAHGADLNLVRIVPSAFDRDGELHVLTLPDHVRELEQIIRAVRARILILDPLNGFVSERVDSHRDASIRRVMAVLSRLAQSTNCTIICIRHLTKQAALENALYRGGGSIAIIAAARAAFIIGFDPADKAPVAERLRVFAHSKANLGPITSSLAFRIRAEAGESVASVQWVAGACSLSANDLLMTAPKPRDRDALQRAEEFLKLELKDGPRRSTEIEVLADEKGISTTTYNRARKSLNICSDREAGKWWLSLPGTKTAQEV
jgi:putative DNA primase/helicase